MEINNKIQSYLGKYDSHVKLLSTIAIIITSGLAIAGGYSFYKSNIWKPKVLIKSVDFDNGEAQLIINGRNIALRGNSVLNAGAVWGVRFGTNGQDQTNFYESIELIKNNMLYEILKVKEV